jgi:hypothetical protein
MEIEPQAAPQTPADVLEFAEPPASISFNDQQPRLKLNLRWPEATDSEFSHHPLAGVWENDSMTASQRSFSISLLWRSVTDRELRNPRIQAGLTFVGFGALGLVFLGLYTRALHPEFDWVALVSEYWYPYAGFASLGVAGLIMLGRESLRDSRNSAE